MAKWKASYPLGELYRDLRNSESSVRYFIRDGTLPSFSLPIILVGILALSYYCFGTILPFKEDYDNKRINNEAVLDSTKIDSIPDSLFVPKPHPLEKRLE